MGSAGALSQPLAKRRERALVALRENLDAAVWQIAHVTAHITRSSFLFGEPPESYALDATRYDDDVCFHESDTIAGHARQSVATGRPLAPEGRFSVAKRLIASLPISLLTWRLYQEAASIAVPPL